MTLIFCEFVSSSDYSNIDGITGFSEEDSQSISSFMRLAVELAKSGDEYVSILVVMYNT